MASDFASQTNLRRNSGWHNSCNRPIKYMLCRLFTDRWFWALIVCLGCTSIAKSDEVRFSWDVLPLLSDRCFHCHGPDASHREADLRLDVREEAIADRGGYAAIVPGKPDDSELLKRVTSSDAETRMPPPDSHRKSLSDSEIETLRTWIAAGAPWGKHWAFEKPARPQLADPKLHPIDELVQRRLQAAKLKPSAEASKHTLIRRVSLDLAGLPPTLSEVEAFVADDSPPAYEQLVERLLKSPHYGERMAMWWLDAARYSDTDGFQSDSTRENWPWRDWVVQAFNENKPFDQFTIEQFAGDLLPSASPEQILATCFHRNHMTNGEGGRDPEESRIDYVIDRVNTTGTVWLGLTLGCCQCHSHKFDPISHQDYYSLFAFFNSIDEDGKAGSAAKPYLKYTSSFVERAVQEAQRVVDDRQKLEAAVRKQAEIEFEPWLALQIDLVREGFEPWRPLQLTALESVEGTVLKQESDGTIQTSGPNPQQDDYRLTASPPTSRITGLRLEVLPYHFHTDGKLTRGASGEFILTDVKLQVRRQGKSQLRDIEIASAIADAEKDPKKKDADDDDYGPVKDTLDDDPRNGWAIAPADAAKPHVAVFALAAPLQLDPDEQLVFTMLHRSTRGDANIGRFRVSQTDQPGAAVRSLQTMPLEELATENPKAPAEVNAKIRERLFQQFLTDHALYQEAKASLDRAEEQLKTVKQSAGELNVMVLKERDEPRPTHVLERGVWDQHGAAVSRSVPAAILPWPAEKTQTRLDLARWLMSPENPLTARVVVNQLWQLCFGAGLVRTPEDFGLQGELPTHPELLDWLACELVEHHWDLQHLLRLIVTSQTYRQSSVVSPELLDRDPENRLLARGARFRVPSWMIRDAALRTSGLLNSSLGGPPTKPYQPDGVWEEMFMGRFRYEPSQGPAQYRRTLYAFWRRAIAPTFLFDSAQRRYCEIRPQRTNTPLHALTLLNDVSVLESARALARLVIAQEESVTARLDLLYRRVLSRSPTEAERTVLTQKFNLALEHYQRTPADAKALLNFGQPEHREADNPVELASYLVVASMVFNLDEAMTHE